MQAIHKSILLAKSKVKAKKTMYLILPYFIAYFIAYCTLKLNQHAQQVLLHSYPFRTRDNKNYCRAKSERKAKFKVSYHSLYSWHIHRSLTKSILWIHSCKNKTIIAFWNEVPHFELSMKESDKVIQKFKTQSPFLN